MRFAVAVCLFLIPSFVLAGTWSHRIVKTYPDGASLVEFTRTPTGDVRVVRFNKQVGDGTEQLARKKFILEASWSKLNSFDLGDLDGEAKDVLWKLVTGIRNNPDLTIIQAVSWYNTNYPDGLYDGVQLLKLMREWIAEEYGVEPTWDQFKTYVINNKFIAVDSYVP